MRLFPAVIVPVGMAAAVRAQEGVTLTEIKQETRQQSLNK